MRLGYGSYVGHSSPTGYNKYVCGDILILDSVADNGNVWFIDINGKRGKIECGSISNMVQIRLIELVVE
jgi:hypothetical protein